MKKYVNVDWQSEKSINQCQKEKSKLESKGFELIQTYGNDRFSTLVYQK